MPSFLISTLARQRARMPGGLLDDATALVSLAEVLDAIPDPRRCRGCRYGLGPLLVLRLVAVQRPGRGRRLGRDHTLRRRPRPRHTGPDRPGPRHPRATTVARLLRRLDGDVLDDALGAWFQLQRADSLTAPEPERGLAKREAVAVDGKTVRADAPAAAGPSIWRCTAAGPSSPSARWTPGATRSPRSGRCWNRSTCGARS
ncbi:transposase family protein [Streptomyces sp. TRM68367]|uniref:transposase family protein n=1 Tax=Streptomyces sp. TRM68367 TaxID=2758415 RepID=UPI00165C0FA9|nr:transposase family protein [Streptomyces sp. TRM68367]MBC9726588.1 transposase family protein [Streptomyces sp. TRM68367]